MASLQEQERVIGRFWGGAVRRRRLSHFCVRLCPRAEVLWEEGGSSEPRCFCLQPELMKGGGGQDCREHQLPPPFSSLVLSEVSCCSVTNSCLTL